MAIASAAEIPYWVVSVSRWPVSQLKDYWRLRNAKTLVKPLALAPGLVTPEIGVYVSRLPTFRMEPLVGRGSRPPLRSGRVGVRTLR